MPKILVVDDELSIRESFSLILSGRFDLLLAASGEAALKIAASQKIDLAFLDIRMPGLNGLETLRMIKEIDPAIEVIMVTAVNDIQKASEAIKLGAREYVVKPFDVNQIIKLTEQLLRKKSMLEEGIAAQQHIEQKSPELIGQSDKISAIIKTIDTLKDEEPVLLLGDIGTEKEMVAELIHNKNKGRKKTFLKAYLTAAMTPFEMKLLFFGQEKGNSTADLSARMGLLEQAKGGSLFIDNVEFLPEEILHTFSLKQFARLGSHATLPLEVNLIGGSSAKLEAVNPAAYNFFKSVVVVLLPLARRISDIPLLVNYYFKNYSELSSEELRISPSVTEAFSNYAWPGNQQQLVSMILRLCLAGREQEIEVNNLPLDVLCKKEGGGQDLIATFEKRYIQEVYQKNNKNKEATAEFLRITPTFLDTKI